MPLVWEHTDKSTATALRPAACPEEDGESFDQSLW